MAHFVHGRAPLLITSRPGMQTSRAIGAESCTFRREFESAIIFEDLNLGGLLSALEASKKD